MIQFRIIFLALILLGTLPHPVFAQNRGLSDEEITKLEDLYLKPTFSNFSKLYWAIDMMDLDKDDHIDNYMLINECDIYRNYRFNEFEWQQVRRSARDVLAKEKETFSVRFKFTQPLRLKEYDFEKKGFAIHEDFDTETSRRFAVYDGGLQSTTCGYQSPVRDYPRALLIELSRPFKFNFVPVPEELAKLYINESISKFRRLEATSQTQGALYNTREAYLEISVKIFAFRGYQRDETGLSLANVIGALEGYTVYADKGKQRVLYENNLVKRDNNESVQKNLEDQYRNFLQKREAISVQE